MKSLCAGDVYSNSVSKADLLGETTIFKKLFSCIDREKYFYLEAGFCSEPHPFFPVYCTYNKQKGFDAKKISSLPFYRFKIFFSVEKLDGVIYVYTYSKEGLQAFLPLNKYSVKELLYMLKKSYCEFSGEKPKCQSNLRNSIFPAFLLSILSKLF